VYFQFLLLSFHNYFSIRRTYHNEISGTNIMNNVFVWNFEILIK